LENESVKCIKYTAKKYTENHFSVQYGHQNTLQPSVFHACKLVLIRCRNILHTALYA